uniref:Uncharacterized protein n=1 Tax=Arundo donax TaxID=35708 RepID=A0A0A9DN81_ARUDO
MAAPRNAETTGDETRSGSHRSSCSRASRFSLAWLGLPSLLSHTFTWPGRLVLLGRCRLHGPLYTLSPRQRDPIDGCQCRVVPSELVARANG